jgi:hypothetical protein
MAKGRRIAERVSCPPFLSELFGDLEVDDLRFLDVDTILLWLLASLTTSECILLLRAC